MFESLSDRLAGALRGLRGKGRLSPADVDATCRQIRVALLEADVALPVARAFVSRVQERALGAEVSGALNPAQQVIKIVNEELVAILGGQTRRLRLAKTPPTVIMLVGLQGSGKTTLAGKLGRWLASEGHQPLLVAADLQRPNAVTQLQVVGERAGVAVFAPEPGNGVGDPLQVARDGLDQARRKQYDVVVIDTAGRLGVDEEMMAQAAAIRAATTPDEVLFVLDAMIGQDAVATAQAFLTGVDFTGVALTKLDGDARGGAALSVRELTDRPIMFASTGERLEDFDVFHPDRMASRILGMGDVLSLIEAAERTFDAQQAQKTADKLQRGEAFTLEDFLEQMEQVRRLGPLSKVLGMLPGMAQVRDQVDSLDERDIDRVSAIIRSMTPAERADPRILNGSRRARIARGSGTAVSEVNNLVTRFGQAQQMMRQLSRGGAPGLGLPGMPALPGPGRGKKAKGRAQQPRGRAARSGNPAKRAAAAAQPPASRVAGAGEPRSDFELPAQLRDLLGPTGR